MKVLKGMVRIKFGNKGSEEDKDLVRMNIAAISKLHARSSIEELQDSIGNPNQSRGIKTPFLWPLALVIIVAVDDIFFEDFKEKFFVRSGKPLDVILHCTHILAFCNFAQIHSPLDLIFCYFIPVRLNFLKSRLDLIIVASVSVLDGEATRIPVTLFSAQVVTVVL